MKNRRIEIIEKAKDLGFNKIEFPIIIQDGFDLDIVYRIEDFFMDSDLYFHKFDDNVKLIDKNGQKYSWEYSYTRETNHPNKFEETLTLEEVRELFEKYFKNSKRQPELGKEKNINELIDKVADYF